MKLVLSLSARRELTHIYAYLMTTAGEATADRFLNEVDRALERLAAFPYSGSRRRTSDHRTRDIRMIPVPGFPHWIYYRALEQKLRVERVLRAGVDLTTLLTPPDSR